MKTHNLFVFLGLLVLLTSINSYARNYDVHGRDLSVAGARDLGHVGIEYRYVIHEMLNNVYSNIRTTSGVRSEFNKSYISEFERASEYWGYGSPSNVNYRAGNFINKIHRNGAKYTLSTRYRSPYSYRKRNGKIVYKSGKYRCDSVVVDILKKGYVYHKVSKPVFLYLAI